MKTGPIIGVMALLLALGAVLWGVSTRTRALAVVAQETRDVAVPAVAVVKPQRGAPREEIVLPGTVQAFTDAAIYARTNGYLKKWHADIGAGVRAGQLLAEIDAPELDQQLQQARADMATAQANARLAQTTAERWRQVHDLLDRGTGLLECSRRLGLSLNTVKPIDMAMAAMRTCTRMAMESEARARLTRNLGSTFCSKESMLS